MDPKPPSSMNCTAMLELCSFTLDFSDCVKYFDDIQIIKMEYILIYSGGKGKKGGGDGLVGEKHLWANSQPTT